MVRQSGASELSFANKTFTAEANYGNLFAVEDLPLTSPTTL